MDWLARRIALLAAIIALATAFIQWHIVRLQSQQKAELAEQKAELAEQRAELAEQRAELENIRECRGEIVVTIDKPKNRDQVPPDVDVTGTSSPHEACRYIFIFFRDVSRPAQPWKVADLVQVNTDGQWAGRVLLGSVPVGKEVKIEARGVAKSDAYKINNTLPLPPERGVPSNIVRVRRIQ